VNALLDQIWQLSPDLTVPAGFVIAAWITIHVLLTKRDVGSAIGWIGLAWFAPFLGSFLYFVLGINRTRRRARRLRAHVRRRPGRARWPKPKEDAHLEPLERAIGRITARPADAGNTFEILNNGDEAYPAMLAAIERARASVGLSSYIMRADEWGMRFIETLVAAHRRGVAVRVIIDGIGGGWLLSPAYHRLRRAGVPAGRFMHSLLPWRMPFINLRTHKKTLVVDGTVGFVGGINIASQNVLADDPPDPVRDTHFRVTGPVVDQLVEGFASDWSFVSGEDLEGQTWFPALAATGDAIARAIESGPDEDLEKVEFAILQAISCARSTIRLMTPYFLADDRLMTALALAAMRGIAVEIVTPEVNDHRLVDWALRANVGPVLKDGARVWLCPPPFRHSKMMVVDSAWSLIGSSNWDVRSLRLNFELCMEVYDRSLAAALERQIEDAKGRELLQAELDARSLPVRLRDASARLLLPYL
jgi:cardiolipin synthase A/B